MRNLHLLALASCLALGPAAARAQDDDPAPSAPPTDGASEGESPPSSIRTLLVVDDPDGGAMTRQLTLSASMLYASLANKRDALGVYVDSEAPVRMAPKSLSKGATFAGLRSSLSDLPDARPTDYAAMKDFAFRAFTERAPGERDAVVILAHSPREGTTKPEIPDGIGDALLKRGVRVFVVGLGDKTSPEDYAALVRPTGGRGYQVTKGKELEQAFSDIFTYLHETEALPVVGDEVVMDASIAKATLVVPKNRGDRTQIVTPGDRVLSARTKHPGVEWKSFADYDLVKLTNPEAGTWRVRQPSKKGGVIGHVNASDLRLRVSVGPRTPMVADRTHIEAWLETEGRVIDSYAQLKHLVIEAEIRDPAGRMRPVRLERTDRGVFSADVDNELQGYHEVRLTAFSPDVQRERRLTYLVNPACFQGRLADTGVVTVDMSRSCPRFAELFARLEVKHEGELVHAASFKRRGMTLSAPAPRPALGETHELNVVIEARTLDGYAVNSAAGGPFEDAARDPTLADYVKAVGERLAILNIPFLVGLLGIVAVRQARRGARGAALAEAEDDQ